MRHFSPFGLLHRLVVWRAVLVGDFYFMIRVYFMFLMKGNVAIIEGTLPCSVLLTEIKLLLVIGDNEARPQYLQ